MDIWRELLRVLADAQVSGIIASVVLITGLGYVLTAGRVFSDRFEKEISRLVLVAAVPALSFNSFMQPLDIRALRQGMTLIAWGFVLYAVLLVISPLAYWRVSSVDQRRILGIITTFGSTTVFGIPIVGAVYGARGVIYASLFNIAYRILLYTYVYIRMSKQQVTLRQMMKILANPIVVATLLGLGCWLFQPLAPHLIVGQHLGAFYRIDQTAPWLYQPLQYLANLAAPLSWLLVGCALGSRLSPTEILTDRLAWYYGVLKSFMVPAVCLGSVEACQLVGIGQISLTGIAAIALLMCSPTSTIPVVYSVNYHQYPLMTAKCSIVSNITSIMALPVWLVVLNLIRVGG